MCDTQSNSLNEQEADESSLTGEIELLRSIYIHEIDIQYESGRPHLISIDLHPATADKTEEQFVKATLHLVLPLEYPAVSPEIHIKNSRGLSDDDLQRIYDELHKKAEEHKGSQALYQIIEAAKEYLTSSNTPSGQCTICLYGFTANDVLTKTICYHYFHSRCLSCYIRASLHDNTDENETDELPEDKSKVVCPVCREEIEYDLEKLELAPPSTEMDQAEEFQMTPELQEKIKTMATLFEYQISKGGIIDVEAEKKKFLLEISNDLPAENEPDSNFENIEDDSLPSWPNEEHSEVMPKAKISLWKQKHRENSYRSRNERPSERNSGKSQTLQRNSIPLKKETRVTEQSVGDVIQVEHLSAKARDNYEEVTENGTLSNGEQEANNSNGANKRSTDKSKTSTALMMNRFGSSNNNDNNIPSFGYRGKYRNQNRGRSQRPHQWKWYDNTGPNRNYDRNYKNGTPDNGKWSEGMNTEYKDNFRPKSDQTYGFNRRGRGKVSQRAQQRTGREDHIHQYNSDYSESVRENATSTSEITGTRHKAGKFYNDSRSAESYRRGGYSKRDRSGWRPKTHQVAVETLPIKPMEDLAVGSSLKKAQSSQKNGTNSVHDFDSRLSKGPPGFCSEKNTTNCMLVGPPPGFREKAPFPRLKPPPGFSNS